MPTRRNVKTILIGSAVAVGLATGAGALLLKSSWASERLKSSMIAFLSDRFDAEVQVESVTLTLIPRVAISGNGLKLFKQGTDQRDPPFLSVDAFRATGGPLSLLRRSVALVVLDGLEANITRGEDKPTDPPRESDLHIDRLLISNGRLVIRPRDPKKEPLEFGLVEIDISDFSLNSPAAYRARLVNPKPRGLIESTGDIGPWNTHELGVTPVAGRYDLTGADLGTIKGLAGTLQSTGRFKGQLDRIDVEGSTTTPDFGLTLTERRVLLETRFQATVDGTSGDTELKLVDAKLGQTRIVTKGSVTGAPGVRGRTIRVNAHVENGLFEDFLALTVKGSEPPMRGQIGLQAELVLPPGEQDVVERVQLSGSFEIRNGHFSSDAVQEKIDALSRRARGQPTSSNVRNVLSTFGGRLTVGNGVLRLPRFRFAVSGAAVDLRGSYRLQNEQLNFDGTLSMKAPLSRTMTGLPSFLMRAINPLFRGKNGGSSVPIRIEGTVQKPSFGLDLGRVF